MTQTFIEILADNEKILHAMLTMPEEMNKQLPSIRREKLFDFLWDEASMEKEEALILVKQRELDFVQEYQDHGVPEWMLRCEAQDVLLEYMHQRFEEEGLLDV